MAEEKKCGTCKWCEIDIKYSIGKCTAPIPFWNPFVILSSDRSVKLADGADCNAFQAREERIENEDA